MILKYCIESQDSVEFLSLEKPVIFQLNGKDTYEAKVVLGTGRFTQGYSVQCLQIF